MTLCKQVLPLQNHIHCCQPLWQLPSFKLNPCDSNASSLDASLLNAGILLVTNGVEVLLVDLLLNGMEIDVGNSIGAIEDAGNLLKGRSLGLGVDEVDKDKFDGDPKL